MRRRTKILLRLTAFLSLVRWTHILFLTVAQVLAALTLLHGPEPTPWLTLAGSIATTALDRVDSSAPAAAPAASAAPAKAKVADGMEPTRHKVARGETAFSIARSYNVSAKALADWNGLGADLAVREGQYLMIPTPTGAPVEEVAAAETAPGNGSPTPTPPSAKDPLPDEKVAPASERWAMPQSSVAWFRRALLQPIRNATPRIASAATPRS